MQRRAQLLQAAQEVFVEKGYHAAGMEDIAERAGVSKPVLYQHFPGKPELYLALVDQHTATLVELVEGSLDSTDDHKERVYASIAAYFEFVAREDSAYRLVFESDLNEVAAVRERILWCQSACSDAVARRIVVDTAMPLPLARLVAQGPPAPGCATGRCHRRTRCASSGSSPGAESGAIRPRARPPGNDPDLWVVHDRRKLLPTLPTKGRLGSMEVKIGIANSARDITIEPEISGLQVEEAVKQAIADGGSLRLEDARGRVVIVPVASLAFVDIGESSRSRVGFGA